jgi:hypothetical protein
MARLSTNILSQWEPVFVTRGVPKQPDYARSKHSIQTSPKLKAFQSCVASSLAGKKFANRIEVRSALASAASSCRGRGL